MKCPECNGARRVDKWAPRVGGYSETCPSCHGTGKQPPVDKIKRFKFDYQKRIESLEAELERVKADNERLRCCGNCEHYHCDSYSNRCIIAIGGNNTRAREPYYVCDEWELAESRGV